MKIRPLYGFAAVALGAAIVTAPLPALRQLGRWQRRRRHSRLRWWASLTAG